MYLHLCVHERSAAQKASGKLCMHIGGTDGTIANEIGGRFVDWNPATMRDKLR